MKNEEKNTKSYVWTICSLDESGNVVEIYDSVRDAERKTGISRGRIAASLEDEKRQKKAGKYRFSYYRDGKPVAEKSYNIMGRRAKKVCSVDESGNVVKVYDSVTAAAKELGIAISSIRMVLSNNKNCSNISAAGYRWSYYEEGKPVQVKVFQDRKIIAVEDKDGIHTFDTIRKAAAFLHVVPSAVNSSILFQGKCRGCRVFYTEETVKNNRKYCTGHAVRLLDKDGNVLKEYPSIRSLSKDIGIDYQNLYSHIDRIIETESLKNCKIEFVDKKQNKNAEVKENAV